MPFEKGISGNPAGRPKGVKDKRRKFLELAESDLKTIADKAIELAKDGNTQMIKLILERVLPAKPEDSTLVDGVDMTGNAYEQARQIMQALSDGEITPAEAQRLMACTKAYIDAVEVKELRQRLDTVEQSRGINH